MLTTTGSDAEFLAQLNKATNFGSILPRPKFLSFNSVQGIWRVETDEKEEDGKSIYKEIGEKANMHIIAVRKLVESGGKKDDTKERYYSREFEGDDLQVFRASDKQMVYSGTYDNLKNNPNNSILFKELKFRSVLYVYAGTDPQIFRVKIKGSQLKNYFAYLKTFVDSNPAMADTLCTLGIRMLGSETEKARPATQDEIDLYENELKALRKPSSNLFYELCFRVNGPIARPLIVERVNAINNYLMVYASQFGDVDMEVDAIDDEAPAIETTEQVNTEKVMDGELAKEEEKFEPDSPPVQDPGPLDTNSAEDIVTKEKEDVIKIENIPF